MRVVFAEVVCPIICNYPWWVEQQIIRFPVPPPPPDPWWEIRDLLQILVLDKVELPVDPQLDQRNKVEALTEMRKGFEQVLEGIDRELKAVGS